MFNGCSLVWTVDSSPMWTVISGPNRHFLFSNLDTFLFLILSIMPVHRYGQSTIDKWTHFLQAADSAQFAIWTLSVTRAVVDSLSSTVSRQSRFFDCRQAFLTVSTEIHVLKGSYGLKMSPNS